MTAARPTRVHSALPRNAYIHVPFCSHHCGYCDFSVIANRLDLVDSYLAAVEKELSKLPDPLEVDTLFLGGGTPTQLGCEGLRLLFDVLDAWLPRADAYECTVEANPEDINAPMAATLSRSGVNRVSLGAQSLQAEKLQRLDRRHTVDDVRRAVALTAPFASVSIDLIFAAPGESLQEWQADVEAVLALGPDHLSTYGLTIERGTQFHAAVKQGLWDEVEEATQRSMYEWTMDRLQAADWEHYEVSNFARQGHRCRHNEVYWTGRPFLGIGPGAASFLHGERRTNHRSVTTFLQRVEAGLDGVVESESADEASLARDRLVFGLRRMEGLHRATFQEETGFDLVDLGGEPLRRFLSQGLLQWKDDHLSLTRDGLLISDSLWPDLLSEG